VSASKFNQGVVEQPISAMIHGAKWLENDRCTFWGSDRTPSLDFGGLTAAVGDVVADEMVTCIPE